MKKEYKFLITVVSVLLVSTLILVGCMQALSQNDSEPKDYDMDIVSQTVAESTPEDITKDPPAAQKDMKEKFAEMSEISEDGKAITVISEEYLDNYWSDGKTKNKALTSEEVLYIIQDSIKIYYEYDSLTVISNPMLESMHGNLIACYPLMNGTLTEFPLYKQAIDTNYAAACQSIHALIVYRLAALSSPDAFITGLDVPNEEDGGFSGEWLDTALFYIPKHVNDTLTREEWVEIILSDGAVPEHLPWLQYFNLSAYGNSSAYGGPFIEHFAIDKAHVRVFPTTEMESSQANMVIDIIDRTEESAYEVEPFWEDDIFVYSFPCIQSQSVFALMYDGREILLVDALKLGYITPEEFDNFDFDYIRRVKFEEKDTEYAFPFSGFTWETVMTDKLRDDGIFPYANVFNSASELKAYTKDIVSNNVYNIDEYTALIPSYYDWAEKYTDTWFEKNTLIVAVIEADSEYLPKPELTYIRTGGTVTVYMAEETLGTETDQVYTVFIETMKIDATGAEVTWDNDKKPADKLTIPPCRVIDIIEPPADELYPEFIEDFWETDKFIYMAEYRDIWSTALLDDGTEVRLLEALEKGYLEPVHFGALGLRYWIRIKHDYVGGKYSFPINMSVSQAVLAEGIGKDEKLPDAAIINSTTELVSFTQALKGLGLELNASTSEIPSYNEWSEKYTGNWFDKNTLIIAFVKADENELPEIITAYVDTGSSVKLFTKLDVKKNSSAVYALFIETLRLDAERVVIDENFNAYSEHPLYEKYPEYFGLDGMKGVEVYVWQIEDGSYRCGALKGTNRMKTNEEIQALFENGATIEEMRTILEFCEVDKSDISVIPVSDPLESDWYQIDIDEISKYQEIFWGE